MSNRRTRFFACSAAIIAAMGVAHLCLGHGMIPQATPVDRLVANLTQYIKEHPDDPVGYYRLGRVHTLALETKSGFVPAFDVREGEPPQPAEGSWANRQWGQKEEEAAPVTPEQLKTHLSEAVTNLNKAIQLRPNEAVYRLTLACALEAGEPLMKDVTVWPLVGAPIDENAVAYYRERLEESVKDDEITAELIESMREDNWEGDTRDIIMSLAYARRDRPEYKKTIDALRTADWNDQIADQFFTAMCYALPFNGKATEQPIWGGMEDWVSYEAGKDFIRVVEAREERKTDKIRLRIAKETIKAFDALPHPMAITPIVIDLAGRALADLQSPRAVRFDLDGSGRPQAWSWLKPDVGILVWDPDATGHITSGHQMFGSVSWWLFFEDGYQAMDLLDDNRDHELTGSELAGLALWFDRNENGVSDAGEVEPVTRHRIAAIACRATGADGASRMNATGLRLADGRVLATFDWIATRTDARNDVPGEGR